MKVIASLAVMSVYLLSSRQIFQELHNCNLAAQVRTKGTGEFVKHCFAKERIQIRRKKYLENPFTPEAKLSIADLVFKNMNKNNCAFPTFQRAYQHFLKT